MTRTTADIALDARHVHDGVVIARGLRPRDKLTDARRNDLEMIKRIVWLSRGILLFGRLLVDLGLLLLRNNTESLPRLLH